MPFAGETVPLSHQAYDFDASLEVYAIVKRMPGGTALAGSPFHLPTLGDGKYSSDALIMPYDVSYLEITYKVLDSDGIDVSEKYSGWGSVARKNVTVDGTTRITQVERLEALVRQRPRITGLIRQNKIMARVKEC